jgi:hypothetical protein
LSLRVVEVSPGDSLDLSLRKFANEPVLRRKVGRVFSTPPGIDLEARIATYAVAVNGLPLNTVV